ncbi:MAG: CPBP family intramembrane glutamic endopeptidase [bacterium]
MGLILLLLADLAVQSFLHPQASEQQVSLSAIRVVIAAEAGVNLVLMGIVPLLWAWQTRVGGWDGAVRYLGLETPGRGLVRGLGWGLAALGALIALGIVLKAIGVHEASEQTALISSALTWPLALALALGAAIGEEIFFRGILQKRIGWIWQAVVFGLVHLSYGTVLQIAFPLALGLFWGWLRKRGESLWALMAAHFLFDFVQLALAIYANEHPELIPQG